MPSINESQFAKFISSFDYVKNVCKVEWNSVLDQYSQLKKVNKIILDKLLQVLDIEFDISDKGYQLIHILGCLKLRYFIIDKKASQNEMIHLIAELFCVKNEAQYLNESIVSTQQSTIGMPEQECIKMLKHAL